MRNLSKYLLITLIFSQAYLFSKDLISITSFDSEFYYFDGFENKLSIYSSTGKLVSNSNLSNLSKGGTADFFVKYNKLNSYLFNSISGIVYLLDENYFLRSFLDLNKLLDLNFYNKLYPLNYNSFLVVSEDLDKLYIVENKGINKILDFSETPIDFYSDKNNIFVLFKDRVEIYLTNAIYQSSIPFKPMEEPMNIFCIENNIFIKHNDGIDRLIFDSKLKKINSEYQTRILSETGIHNFAVIGNIIAVLKENNIFFRIINDK